MRFKLLSCFVLLSLITQAQNEKIKFNSLVQAGLVEGQIGPAMTLQTINGI